MPESEAGVSAIRARLMGAFRLETADGRVVPVSNKRARALLAYILLAPEDGASREVLASLIWSDRGEAQARASLRQCLLELRGAFEAAGVEAVIADRERISLAPGVFASDVDGLLGDLAGDDSLAATRSLAFLGLARLLEDLELGGRFGAWLDRTRSGIDQTIAARVLAHLGRLEAAGGWLAVRAMADVYLRREPLNEAVVAAAIRADGALGEPSAAHKRFDDVRNRLRKAFGAAPGAALRGAMNAVLESARAGVGEGAVAWPGGVRELDADDHAAGEVLLAVLAFDNLSGDRALDYFSDGVSEEIQQTLARGADLKVIGRTSSFQFRGADKVVRRVAAELNATHVLDGSVRKDGPRVRISVQLIECASQTTLWSDRFDRELTDIFALQDEIAAAIATALKTTFANAAPVGKVDPAAYDLYLQARASIPGVSAGQDPRIVMLERAVALAPHLAPAWATLAVRRAWQSRVKTLEAAQAAAARADVESAAARALELNPTSGYAYVALAYLEPWGHYQAHESLLRKAVNASPANMQTLTAMSQFLNTVGRNQEALSFASQAMILDPLHQYVASHHAAMLAFTGHYDECQASYDVLRAKWPLYPEFLSPPLHFAAFRGDWARFDRLSSIANALGQADGIAEALRVGRMLREPTPRRVRSLIQFIEAQLHETGTVEFGPLVVAYKLGLHDETFSFVERATFSNLFADTGPPPAGQFLPGVIFDPISNSEMIHDPRFVRFCDRIGLCDYWIATDRWPDFAATTPYDLRLEAHRRVGDRVIAHPDR